MQNYVTDKMLQKRIKMHQMYSINPEGWHVWLQKILNIQENIRILELACGNGKLWSVLDDSQLKKLALTLTDSSNGMLSSAYELLGKHQNISFQLLDLNTEFDLPVSPDFLICNQALYHVDNPIQTLTRIKEQISDHTQCIFATNGMTNMSEVSAFLPERFGQYPFGKMISKFTLESGYQIVSQVFGQAYLYRYADGLNIRDVESLMAYIQSMELDFSEEELKLMRLKMEEHLSRYGVIYAHKDVGVLCTKELNFC